MRSSHLYRLAHEPEIVVENVSYHLRSAVRSIASSINVRRSIHDTWKGSRRRGESIFFCGIIRAHATALISRVRSNVVRWKV
jgi:hypothetical protein